VIILAEKQTKIGTKTLKTYAGASGFVPDTPNDGASPTAGRRSPESRERSRKPATATTNSLRVAFTRHNEGSNFIFCDGHAKYHKLEQTLGQNFLWGEYYYPGGTGSVPGRRHLRRPPARQLNLSGCGGKDAPAPQYKK